MWSTVLMCCLLVVASCGQVDEAARNRFTCDEDTARYQKELRHLPSLEETEAQMSDLIVQTGDAVAKIAPRTDWRWNCERSQGGCSMPRLETTGLSVDTPSRLSDVPITEELWAQSFAAAREMASAVGIDGLVVRVDLPGRHDVARFDDFV